MKVKYTLWGVVWTPQGCPCVYPWNFWAAALRHSKAVVEIGPVSLLMACRAEGSAGV